MTEALVIKNLSIDKCKIGSIVSAPIETLKSIDVEKLNTVLVGFSTS